MSTTIFWGGRGKDGTAWLEGANAPPSLNGTLMYMYMVYTVHVTVYMCACVPVGTDSTASISDLVQPALLPTPTQSGQERPHSLLC